MITDNILLQCTKYEKERNDRANCTANLIIIPIIKTNIE